MSARLANAEKRKKAEAENPVEAISKFNLARYARYPSISIVLEDLSDVNDNTSTSMPDWQVPTAS